MIINNIPKFDFFKPVAIHRTNNTKLYAMGNHIIYTFQSSSVDNTGKCLPNKMGKQKSKDKK